mgnify:CR=1 FL=1
MIYSGNGLIGRRRRRSSGRRSSGRRRSGRRRSGRSGRVVQSEINNTPRACQLVTCLMTITPEGNHYDHI